MQWQHRTFLLSKIKWAWLADPSFVQMQTLTETAETTPHESEDTTAQVSLILTSF